jgi:hypothetical protein
MQRDEILAELRAFVAREYLEGRDDGLDEKTPLLEWGLINSFSLVALQGFMRSSFGVEVPHSELVAANLKDLGAITQMVLRLSSGRAG